MIEFYHLGDGEETNPRQDDEGHGIEPAADVGEEPEGESKLDGVQHVLNLKQKTLAIGGRKGQNLNRVFTLGVVVCISCI